ncbi:SET domain-containing protein [Phlegmacium glaucopus]|nr:SET domain-containing protein [Phlegmacium glaucopus]
MNLRGFLNTSKGKKAIQREPITPKNTTPVTSPGPPALAGLKSPIITMPFGKVEDIEIDKDYAYDNRVFEDRQPTEEDLPDNSISMTTIPIPYMNQPDDPDGYTQWLVKGNTKKKVLNTPGYPRPIPKPPKLNFIVKATPAMGMGMFATRNISFGELILSERPLLIYPRSINIGYDAPDHYSIEQFTKVVSMETEKKLERMLSRMNEEERNAYLELANSHKEDGSGPLLGIMRTNGFGIDYLADGPHGAPITVKNGYTAVCKLGSRINHSCIANVQGDFCIPSFSMQFVAVADIKAGEQIVYSYCMGSTECSKAIRAEQLLPYGIVCTCPACEDPKL